MSPSWGPKSFKALILLKASIAVRGLILLRRYFLNLKGKKPHFGNEHEDLSPRSQGIPNSGDRPSEVTDITLAFQNIIQFKPRLGFEKPPKFVKAWGYRLGPQKRLGRHSPEKERGVRALL